MKQINKMLAAVKREIGGKEQHRKKRMIMDALKKMTTEQLKEIIELVETDGSDKRIIEICASVGLVVE